MSITPDDQCDVCEQSLFDVKQGFKECPLCNARICNPCFEESKKVRGNLCPSCGGDPSTRQMG